MKLTRENLDHIKIRHEIFLKTDPDDDRYATEDYRIKCEEKIIPLLIEALEEDWEENRKIIERICLVENTRLQTLKGNDWEKYHFSDCHYETRENCRCSLKIVQEVLMG